MRLPWTGTGFGTQCFYRHYSAKYGHDQYSRDYVKLHALVGTKTNVIAEASLTDRDRHDYPEFAPLVEAGAKTFAIAEVSADKAYIGRSNLAAVAAIGAEAYIPFKKGQKDDTKSNPRPCFGASCSTCTTTAWMSSCRTTIGGATSNPRSPSRSASSPTPSGARPLPRRRMNFC